MRSSSPSWSACCWDTSSGGRRADGRRRPAVSDFHARVRDRPNRHGGLVDRVPAHAAGVARGRERTGPAQQRCALGRAQIPSHHLCIRRPDRHGPRAPALAVAGHTRRPSAGGAEWVGIALVLVSATPFGTNAIFAKLAYRAGLTTTQTLAFRFVLAALGMWVLAVVLRQNPLRFDRRALLALFALGGVVYTGQALTYFTALQTLPASLCVLIVYVYPSLVVIAGRLFLRRFVTRRHVVALAASFGGLVLLVGGAELHAAWGLVFAIAAPVIYTAYILLSERVMTGVPAVGASAVIMSGAGIAFAAIARIQGELKMPASSSGWLVVAGLAAIPTMLAISTFLAGLPRVGAARASLVSTWEPVVTVILAVALFADRFSAVQALGGLLILTAVMLQAGRAARTAPRAADAHP